MIKEFKGLRGFISGVLITLLLVTSISAYGTELVQQTINVVFNKVNIALDGNMVGEQGKNYTLNNGEQVPYSILYKGTTYVPIRKVAEIFEKQVKWDGNTNTAGISEKKEEDTQETIENAYGVKLFEDDKVKISYLKTTSNGMEFMVENKTDVVLTIQADTLAVNGISFSGYINMSDDVSPQSRGKVFAECKIENYDETIETVSGQLSIIDFVTYDSYDATFVNVKVD
ncbi:MAG: stalk domain-containing protein [Eubacteriales bacterium]